MQQKIAPEVSPDVFIAANPGFPARNWNPSWKCWPMFWTFWGKILIFNGVARPICPNHYPNILEEDLICCAVFRQRSLIRTHRELGKSSPEEDRCTSLLVHHSYCQLWLFFCKNVTTESDRQTHLLINQHTRSVLVTFGTKRAPGN